MENIIHPSRRLGKGPAVLPAGVRAFSDYLDKRRLPIIPPNCANSRALPDTPMLGNDNAGDCTFAAKYHQARAWVYGNGGKLDVDTSTVIADYSRVTGYDPSKPDTDNGAIEAEVLRDWHRNPALGVTLDGMANVNPRAIDMITACIYLMGGCYIGVELPAAVMYLDYWPAPPNHRGDWAPNSWGGHAVTILDYDRDAFTCISWGKRLHIAPKFLLAYCTEAWALLSKAWADANGAPNGLDYDAIAADMPLIGH